MKSEPKRGDKVMKLKSVRLVNYRCFTDTEWGKNPAPCHIAMAGFRELPSEPDLHLSAYPALQMSV